MSCRSSTAQVILAEEVDQLRNLVQSLEQRVAFLEAKLADSEFCLIEQDKEEEEPSREQLPVAPSSSAALQTVPIQQIATSGRDQKREATLRTIGCWLRATLAGQRRGLSGREQLKESSHFYLVLRSIGGEVFNPVRVYTSFAQASRVVKHQGRAGDSVFVGLPTLEDCKAVTQAAGLDFPSQLDG